MAPKPVPLFDREERRAPRQLVEHALILIGRIHHGDAAAAQRAELALQTWRESSSEHAEAALTAQRIWNATEPGALRSQIAKPASAAQRQRLRRRALGLAGVGVGLGLLGVGGRWAWRLPVYEIALRTGRAQRMTQALPDGSSVDLSARTAAQVTFLRARRTVRLTEGEARFSVASDAERPFWVETDWGRVRVVGTVFTVSTREARMRVEVAEGRVAVWGAENGQAADPAPSVFLQAGQAADVDSRGVGSPRPVDPGEVGGWRQGWLFFRDTPLPEVVSRWNDYLSHPLRLSPRDVALREMRVTGSYLLKDPQSFLDSLTHMLPVRVMPADEQGIEIRARG